jgi:Glycosyltransferase family 87
MKCGVRSRFVEAGQKPAVAALAGCAIAFYLVYHLSRFQLSMVWPLVPRGDASIIFDQARNVFEQATYSSNSIFPYPPAAVLVFNSLSVGGPAIFMGAWYFLMVAGLVVSVRASLAQESDDTRSAWLLIGLVSILVADAPISWDLRNANSNLICLGLVMMGYGLLGPLPVVAGTLVGLAFSLKLYTGLLLLYLFISGPRRAIGAAVMTVFILGIVLPLAIFGPEGALKLYSSWKEQLRIISDPFLHASLAAKDAGPPLVTLQRAVVNVTGGEFGSEATRAWLLAFGLIWAATLSWYAWCCREAFRVPVPSRAALADWVVLMLAPLPLSPWLEPYHAVPLLVGALLCVVVALDEAQVRSNQIVAVAVVATLLLFLVFKIPFAVRGFGLGAQFLVVVLALGYLRRRLAKQRTGHSGKTAFKR